MTIIQEHSNIKSYQPSSRILAKNALLNFLGQAIVAIIAIILVPLIVKGLGYEAYGLLALALVMFGSFSLLELGLGRSTTKFIAEYLNCRDWEKLSSVFWLSLGIQLSLGILAGVIIARLAPFIAKTINIEADQFADAINTLYILALSAPFVLGSSSLRGTLEGAQRFDLVNYVKIVINISTYLIPVISIKFHLNVPTIVFLIFVVRVLASIGYLFSCLYILPPLRKRIFLKNAHASSLLSYSGWVAVSNIIVPLLTQIDRYFLATIVSVSAVTFYTVPFEILNGLWIIPGSISGVLFPAFSSLYANKNTDDIVNLYIRPIKYILLTLTPIILIITTFAKDILLLWQGTMFAENSTIVLQILVIGVLINSLEWVPASLLMGIGRADLPAKVHIVQTPLYLGLAYIFILKWA
jgi:O-antigen/teichoic acid export membrane protein